MSQGDLPISDATLVRQDCSPASLDDFWFSGLSPPNPDVVKVESPEPDSQGLHHCFASGEPNGQRWHRIDLGLSVSQLFRSENSGSGSWRPLQHLTETLNVNGIDTNSDNHRPIPL
jgi:hypothetical protein